MKYTSRYKVLKRILMSHGIIFLLLFVSACSNESDEQITSLTQQNETLEADLKSANATIKKLSDDIVTLEENDKVTVEREEKLKKEFDEYKKEMKPYEALATEEAEARTQELTKKREAEKAETERLAAEKKAAEETAAAEKKAAEEKAVAEEKARLAEELARGYETGITFDQLARTPDDYIGEKIKFYGKVVQVMEGDSSTTVRFAVDDNYDTILYCEIPKSLIENNRILEDDYVTFSGISFGLLSYKSTLGGEITIPSMMVDVIDR